MKKNITPQEGYKLLKESGSSFLSIDGPYPDGKYWVYPGNKHPKDMICMFSDYDEADEFVQEVHAIYRRIDSARNLRSFFGR